MHMKTFKYPVVTGYIKRMASAFMGLEKSQELTGV